MAKYCNDECKLVGGVCDFCIYYEDDEVIYGLDSFFQGYGKCKIKNISVQASDGCDDDFYCMNCNDFRIDI